MPDIADSLWAEVDDLNSDVAPNGFPPGMPAYIDQIGRMMMGAIKRSWGRQNPIYETTGTADAYIVSPTSAPNAINLYELIYARIDRANTTTAPTFQYGMTNPRTIMKFDATGKIALAAGDLVAGNSHGFWYDGTEWILVNPGTIEIAEIPGLQDALNSKITGPASSTDGNFIAFDGETGKLGKDSGSNAASFATEAQGAKADSAVQPTDTDASGFDFVTGKTATPADPSKVLPTVERVDAETVYKVADRTALAALNTATHTAAYLLEDGREGAFVWRSGNLSAFVTADTQQGIYVAPSTDTTGASGAWVRQHDGKKNLLWFGAAGDGTTDDYAAIGGWIDTLPHFECYAPANVYRSSGKIERTYSSANESDRIAIRGAGREATFFAFDATSGGGFLFIFTQTTPGLVGPKNFASFHDIGILAGGAGNGNGLHVEAQNGAYVTADFDNIKAARNTNTAYWDIAISVNSISVVFFNKLLGDSTNYNGRFIQVAAEHAHIVEFNISNVHCSGFDISVAMEGMTYGIEGLNVSSSSLIACNKAIYADNSSSPGNYPQITWHGLHLNAQVACIHAKNFAQIGGAAGLFYIQNTVGVQTDGILLEYTGVAGSSATTIRGTELQALGTQTGANSTGVRFTGLIYDCSVDVTASNFNVGVSAPAGNGVRIAPTARFIACAARTSGFTALGVVNDSTRINLDQSLSYENIGGALYSVNVNRMQMRVQSAAITVANATKDTLAITFDKAFANGLLAAFTSPNTDPGAGVTIGLSGGSATGITVWVRGATVGTVIGITVCAYGY